MGNYLFFPAVFGKNADLSLDSAKAKQLFLDLSKDIQRATGKHKSPEQIAEGFISIATENMANAIKKISVQKGYNVAEYTLCCYGAAGGQHACKVADSLGMQRVLLHPFAGVLSAYGMGLADFRLLKDKALEQAFDSLSYTQLEEMFAIMQALGKQEMLAKSSTHQSIEFMSTIRLRYLGTDTALAVTFADKKTMLISFEQAYLKQFGFVYTGKALIIG